MKHSARCSPGESSAAAQAAAVLASQAAQIAVPETVASSMRATEPDSRTPIYDAVVIGGGIAGLVAARELAVAGLSVCLIEAAPTLGGRVRRVQLAGLSVEMGAEAFATRGGAAEALLEELNLTGQLRHPHSAPAWVITAQTANELPTSGALGIPVRPLRTRKTIGLCAALWAASEPWRPRSRHASDASLAEVTRARLGARATAVLVAPVVEGVYSAAPDKLLFEAQEELASAYARHGSLVRAAREVRSANLAAGGAVATLAGGLSGLVDRLIDDLRGRGVTLLTDTPVTAVDAALSERAVSDQRGAAAPRPRWRVRFENGELATPLVVCAVPPSEVARMMPDAVAAGEPAPRLAESDSAVEPDSAAEPDTLVETVALVVDAPALAVAPRGSGALIRPGHPHIKAKALTHATAKWEWLAKAAGSDRHVLRLSYGSKGSNPATAELSDEAAAALALTDAGHVLGVTLDPSQLVAHSRARWRIPAKARRTPQARQANDRRDDPRLAPTFDGVFLTGETYSGTGLARVIPHARQVAREAAVQTPARTAQASETTTFTPKPQSPAPLVKSKGLDPMTTHSATEPGTAPSGFTLWAVFRRDPALTRTAEQRAAATDEQALTAELQAAVDRVTNRGVTLRGWYDVSGLRADADLMVWLHGDRAEDLQTALRELRRTDVIAQLLPTWNALGVHRDAEFNRSHVPGFLRGESAREWLVLYPFVRDSEWYLLPDADRGRMLADHGRKGAAFRGVVANTVSAFALGDYEWLLPMESDDLTELVDLMRDLRATDARRHMREETPFFTGRRISAAEVSGVVR